MIQLVVLVILGDKARCVGLMCLVSYFYIVSILVVFCNSFEWRWMLCRFGSMVWLLRLSIVMDLVVGWWEIVLGVLMVMMWLLSMRIVFGLRVRC